MLRLRGFLASLAEGRPIRRFLVRRHVGAVLRDLGSGMFFRLKACIQGDERRTAADGLPPTGADRNHKKSRRFLGFMP